jgi:hypothetical protein
VAAGRDASSDTWELLELLTICEAALVAFEQATGRARPASPSPAAATAALPPLPPTGFINHAAQPGNLGPGGGPRGPAGAVLVARRWLAARKRRTPLSAWRVLARDCLHPADRRR